MRLEMLEEAVEIIRTLWQGGQHSHRGRHYTVENARVYDLPDAPPPVFVSGFGPKAIDVAARIGDGFVTTSPDADAIGRYRSGRRQRAGPRRHEGLLHGRRGRRAQTAHRLWPNEGLPGELAQVLPTPGALRAGLRAGHGGHARRRPSAGPRRARRALQEYATPASTSSTSSRSAPSRTRSSRRWAPAVLPRSPGTGRRRAKARWRPTAGFRSGAARVAPRHPRRRAQAPRRLTFRSPKGDRALPLGTPSAPARSTSSFRPSAGRRSGRSSSGRRPRAPSGSSWSTTAGDGRRAAGRRCPGRRRRPRCAGAPARPGRGAQRRLARRRARSGSRSSTTTCEPAGGWRAALAADLAAAGRGRRRRRRAGSCVPAARRPAPDRLGAQRRRARARALGHGGPRLPPRGARGRRRLRRALPARLPRGRRPRPARHARAGWRDRARARAVVAPGRPGAARGSACASRPATPTTC